MNNYPRITICITAHRCDRLFRRAVHSVKHQQQQPYEVILVIDSKNTPNTEYWLKNIPDTWQVVWTGQDDSTPSIVRNMGMYQATGDWILFLDGDDFLVPSCIGFYEKQLLNTKADIVSEFTSSAIIHGAVGVTKNVPPDRDAWNEAVKFHTKGIYSGAWKKGEFPIRPMLMRLSNKKYFPMDYGYLEDKVLILQYMLEERKILLSDYCGYITNIHPKAISQKYPPASILRHSTDEVRFRRIASNIHITGWTAKDKIFEQDRTYSFFSDADRDYIDKTVAYLNTPSLD